MYFLILKKLKIKTISKGIKGRTFNSELQNLTLHQWF